MRSASEASEGATRRHACPASRTLPKRNLTTQFQRPEPEAAPFAAQTLPPLPRVWLATRAKPLFCICVALESVVDIAQLRIKIESRLSRHNVAYGNFCVSIRK